MEKKIVGLNTYFKSLEYENFRINLVFQIIILRK